ncbi:hypothetical protein BD410DRAFT_845813 [Rickenella mellea]|uniref:Uncharacterized protein n=1 Tax=Rickenella mellea TaxID=50990 RepID=A0A4Y7PI24_9AGAM|nr:hypothetical protein BD410DRAFT_845813 [Rickenella mellea]
MATRIDIPGLDNLITLLTLLKSHGANADEVWDRVPYGKSTSSSGSLSPDAGKSFRQSLDEAKLCMDALNQVQAQLRRRIQTLRKSCIPLALEDGIKSLPNEVLGQIFEAGHYMTDNGMFGKHMSHVCQYFRQVSLRNPLLWSRIADFYTVDQLATFLSRSGHADLDVSIECTDQELRSAFGFIQRLRPHSDRWTQLRVRYKPPESGEAHIPTTARPGLQLPRLQHFYYDYHIDLSSWDLPSISHLHGYDRFLFPTQNFMSQLTSFEWITNQAAVFTEISQAIYSMSNLQLLSLTFVGCEEGVF